MRLSRIHSDFSASPKSFFRAVAMSRHMVRSSQRVLDSRCSMRAARSSAGVALTASGVVPRFGAVTGCTKSREAGYGGGLAQGGLPCARRIAAAKYATNASGIGSATWGSPVAASTAPNSRTQRLSGLGGMLMTPPVPARFFIKAHS